MVKLSKEALQSPEELVATIGQTLFNLATSTTSTTPAVPAIDRTCLWTASSEPAIDIRKYVSRIDTYFPWCPEAAVAMLIYLDRATVKVDFTRLNAHRLIFAAAVLALKYTVDVVPTNKQLAPIGGLRLQELNSLEVAFMNLVDHRLHVTVDEYHNAAQMLRAAASGPAAAPKEAEEVVTASPWQAEEMLATDTPRCTLVA